MRFPVKINENCLPNWLHRYLPSKSDPRKLLTPSTCVDYFEDCITAIKIGDTWKSTQKRRHLESDQLIVEATKRLDYPSFLEIGASAGSTSIELLDSLGDNYSRFYVTDLFFNLKCAKQGKITYFYHPLNNQCIMCVTDHVLMYEDVADAVPPFGWIAKYLIEQALPIDSTDSTLVSLLHPRLREHANGNPKIVVIEHNVFKPWAHESVDVVKVANVLNRLYFTDDEILKALIHLKNALNSKGLLLVTDNREDEKVSIFSKNTTGKYVIEEEINGGTDIADIVVRA